MNIESFLQDYAPRLLDVDPCVVLLNLVVSLRVQNSAIAERCDSIMKLIAAVLSTLQLVKRIRQSHTTLKLSILLFQPELERRLSKRYFIKSDLPTLVNSPWRVLYASTRDSAFLLSMGVDRSVFQFLLPLFGEQQSEFRSGVRRHMNVRQSRQYAYCTNVADDLAIVLHFLRTSGLEQVLSRIFGLSQATINRRIHEGVSVLLLVLKKCPEARIAIPQTKQELDELVELSSFRESALENVIGFMDGMKLNVREPTDTLNQNRMYNGYTCSVQCTNLLVFAPDGCIMYAKMNCEGATADSEMANNFYETLIYLHIIHDRIYRVVADSAFRATGEMKDYIYKPLTKKYVNAAGSVYSLDGTSARDRNNRGIQQQATTEEIVRNVAVVSVRQSVEWGMRSVQSVWGRLHALLPLDTNFRGDIIECCYRMHNLNTRTSTVIRNQISKVYDKNYIPNIFNRTRHSAIKKLSQYYHYAALTTRLTQAEIMHQLEAGGIFEVDDELLFNFSNLNDHVGDDYVHDRDHDHDGQHDQGVDEV